MAKFFVFLIKYPLDDESEYTINRPEVDSRGFILHSRAKVCPWCLTIWARIEREDDSVYAIESQSCEQCWGPSYPMVVPGSLLDNRVNWTEDMDLLAHLPPDLVEREYRLHIKYFERHQANEQSNRSSSNTSITTAPVVRYLDGP